MLCLLSRFIFTRLSKQWIMAESAPAPAPAPASGPTPTSAEPAIQLTPPVAEFRGPFDRAVRSQHTLKNTGSSKLVIKVIINKNCTSSRYKLQFKSFRLKYQKQIFYALDRLVRFWTVVKKYHYVFNV